MDDQQGAHYLGDCGGLLDLPRRPGRLIGNLTVVFDEESFRRRIIAEYERNA